MRHFVTTAHAPLLPQLRVLHASMRRHCGPFRLHVLCEGEEVTAWAREQDDVSATRVTTLLTLRPSLRPENLPGPPRNGNELACCWRWWYLADLVETYGEPMTAVDADVMFWSSPEPVFEEIGPAGAAVLPHAFPPAAEGLPGVSAETHGRFGRFNGGFVYFDSDARAMRMAELAAECSHARDHVWPDGRTTWGDQGALELLDARVIQHPGAAVGPWNVHTRPLERSEGDVLLFGGRPLVAYHYSSFRLGGQLANPEYGITARQAELLYRPYLAALGAL